MKNNEVVAGLDIGSNKIVCLIGIVNSEGNLYLKGLGHQEAKGIKDGEIIDLKLLTKSIISSISYAETMAGINVEEINVNISGNEIKSVILSLEETYNNKTIKKSDLENLSEKIQNSFYKDKKQVLHLFPINYSIDSKKVDNPFGMEAKTFSVDFNTIYTSIEKVNSLKNCLKKTPIKIKNFIHSAYASACACLSPDEKENGTLLIDIGATNSSFILVDNNVILYTSSIAIAGNTITMDLATILNTRFDIAEKVKILNTNLLLTDGKEDDIIRLDIDSDEEYRISKNKIKLVNDVYKERLEQIITIIMDVMYKKNLLGNINKIVLTGGSVCATGAEFFIQNLTYDMNIDIRVAVPDCNLFTDNIETKKLKTPTFSTAVGLLKCQSNRSRKNQDDYKNIGNNKINRIFDSLIKLFIS